jgi:hypothetical protein
MRLALLLLLPALLVVLCACAPPDPYADGPGRKSTSSPPTAHRLPPGELPGTVPADRRDEPRRFPQAASTPTRAVENAVDLYGNWNSNTVRAHLTRLASVSVGTARAQMRQAAAQAGPTGQLGEVRSRARLAGIDVAGADGQRTAVVVTHERVTGDGLPDEGWRYRVTLARLKRRAEGWVISRWSVQP